MWPFRKTLGEVILEINKAKNDLNQVISDTVDDLNYIEQKEAELKSTLSTAINLKKALGE